MAKQAQQPGKTISLTSTGVNRLQFSHPIAIASVQKKHEQQQEIQHIVKDLRKTFLMIGFLIAAEVILFFLLTKHIVIIPTVNY